MNPAPRSRLKAQPRGRRIPLTSRDLELFRVLDRYRYLPSNFLHAFVGGHVTYHRQRLTDLFHEGWLLKPSGQWESFNARYRPNCYALSQKSRQVLTDTAGISTFQIGAGAPFWHEHLVCLIMASFELAARHDGVDLLGWREVLSRSAAPIRDSASPFSIPVQVPELDGALRRLRPDGLPFGLKAERTLWFVGIEADRHTEPLHPTDLRARSSSILLKILQYRQFVRQRLFETLFGLPNVLVPVVTVNETHLKNMIDLVLKLTDGRGFKWLLFKSLHDLASHEMAPQPQLDLLSAPWRRAGNPPISLLEEVRRA